MVPSRGSDPGGFTHRSEPSRSHSLDGHPLDIVVVGAGIVGLATARALARGFDARVVVVETEATIASHQTGHNSGVAHSGLYYKPGSQKARLCVEARAALEQYCAERGVGFERCGKLVLATRTDQVGRLDELEARGNANGLQGLERLSADQIAEYEPHARGVAALRVPETGIVDFPGLARAFAAEVTESGGRVVVGARVTGVARRSDEIVVTTTEGEHVCHGLVGCAGLQSDRLARLCGLDPGVSIVPFRGEYYELVAERRSLVRNLIYPVPDPAFPFLGVHFTRKLSGGIEAGPNAVLALSREGYRWSSFSFRDALGIAFTPGFWGFASRNASTAWMEVARSLSKRRFAAALAELVPEVTAADLAPGGAGVRAQAMDRSGRLVDDFHVVEDERTVHVLNAPSPAATASLRIGEWVAKRVADRLRLPSAS